ncbi:MAG: thioredoxin family protein [Bacteroides sp.]|nr:thioredoxin family protein [Bacteroides sp.]
MKKFAYISALALLLGSCSKGDKEWTLYGELPQDSESIVLELPSATGGWYAADSVSVDSNGRFTLTRPRANSQIYRLKIGGQYVYVPADSTETLSLVMNPGGGYVIEGSREATLFSEINDILSSPADSTTNRRLLKALQDDFGSTAAYYAFLRTEGKSKTLLRAVANAYSTQKPDDPRTAILMARLRAASTPTPSGETIVIEAPELGYFDIELLNRKGEVTSLSSVADTHSLTLLAFVNSAAETAPAVNLNIGEAYTAYPQLGVYEVGFGENQHQWAEATAELPWTNVFQSESASQTHLGQYNISAIPTFFLIKNGEIIERINNPADIKSTISKYL